MTTESDGSDWTWILFSSGNRTRVDVRLTYPNLHTPDVRFVNNSSGATVINPTMCNSASLGREAALTWFNRDAKEVEAQIPSYDITFELLDLTENTSASDASGGLAFAVAVVRKVRKVHKIGNDALGAVAAVGKIDRPLETMAVRKVEEIKTKIEGALKHEGELKCLSEGDRLIYPKDNYEDIKGDLETILEKRRIDTQAVASVDDALDWLFPRDVSPSPQPWLKPWLKALGLLLIVGVAGAVALAIWYERRGVPAPVEPPAVDVEIVSVEPDESAEVESMAASSVCCRQFPNALLDKVAEVLHAAPGVSRVERKPAPLGAACFSIEHTTTAAALSEWLRHNLRTAARHRAFHVVRDGASGAIELVFDGGFD